MSLGNYMKWKLESWIISSVLICRKPSVVGITSLGLDHVSLLGNTVENIAVHKAGIMKPSVPTYTVSDQPGESLSVLAEKALQIKV
jgi:folylpolyglutamate synthase